MEAFIKQFKRDIILCSEDYWRLEKETREPVYTCENLILEQNQIIYSYYRLDDNEKAGIIYSSKDEFLKADINNIIRKCNEVIYYN